MCTWACVHIWPFSMVAKNMEFRIRKSGFRSQGQELLPVSSLLLSFCFFICTL